MTLRIAPRALAVATVVALARPLAAQQSADTSLYVRLGGVYAIALVVDYFVDRLEWNPTIRANPAVREALTNPVKPGLKYRIIEMVCEATGGPCRYTGRPMDESHETLGISEGEWQAMVEEFRRSLRRYKVPARESDELLAVVASTKTDIVTRP